MTKPNFIHHFLLPNPKMDDERFIGSLIYVCRHTSEGAWGFVINQPLSISVGGLLGDLNLPSSQKNMSIPAMNGGPVRPEAGFILHTGLPNYKASFAISENICLTTSKDVLEDLSNDQLRHFLLCMGYCNWGKGQLDAEIFRGDWLVCPADLPTIFGTPFDERLANAFEKLGVNPDKFIDSIGVA